MNFEKQGIKSIYICDIECNGLDDADTVWVLSYFKYYPRAEGGIVNLWGHEAISSFMNSLGPNDLIVGHNWVLYDRPVLQKVLGVSHNCKTIDTLALSWYLYPSRIKHGLEVWGTEMGHPKVKVEEGQWLIGNRDLMVERCQEDVKITTKVFHKQLKDLLTLYEDNLSAVWYIMGNETFKMEYYRLCQKYKIKLDLDLIHNALPEMEELLAEKNDALIEVMPKQPIKKKKSKPKNIKKKDGTLNLLGEKWFKFLEEQGLPKDTEDIVEYVSGYKDANPGSSAQVKAWLYDLGWEPESYSHIRDKKTNETRKVEQIRIDGKEGKELCPSVVRLIDKVPELQLLEGKTVLEHRIAILKGFLRDMDSEGCIAAGIRGFALSGRIRHKVLVNMPAVSKPYGKIIRGCLRARDGHIMCGTDLSSLENTTMMNLIYDLDPDYVHEMMSEDYDSHISMALEAGLVTQDDAEFFKVNKELEEKEDVKRFNEISKQRAIAKTVNFASMYGAGIATLARQTGLSKHMASKVLKAYNKKNWAKNKVAKSLLYKECIGFKWIFSPITGYWLPLRAERDRWSVLNQHSGSFIFFEWCKEHVKQGLKVQYSAHDETIIELLPEDKEKVRDIVKENIDKVNKKLKLKIPISCSVEFGNSYDQIH